MSSLAKYALIFETGDRDDWVEKRKKAIQDIQAGYGKLTMAKAILRASSIARALGASLPLEDAIAAEGETYIQEYAQSFVRTSAQGELQIKVLFAVAAIDLFSLESPESAVPNVDALAAAFWSALSHQRPLQEAKVEELRKNLLESSRKRVQTAAARSRERRKIPPIGAVNIAQDSEEGQKVNAAFSRAVEPMISVMRENAALDREELDFMWWLLSERSDILDESLVGLAAPIRAVAAGFDAASKLRKLPADAHRNIVLRNLTDETKLSLEELVTALGERRSKLASGIGQFIANAPAVFPLMSAISTGSAAIAEFTDEKLAPQEWGARALLEGAIHHMHANTAGGL